MSADPRPVIASTGALRAAEPLVESRFIPQRYEPNYAYPLLVLLHGRGADEQQWIEAMPTLSWRNYVGLGLRGPEPIARDGQEIGYGWGTAFGRRDPRPRPREAPAEVVRRTLAGTAPDAIDRVETGVFEAVRGARQSLHIHSERIFLVGCGEGAAVAYRLGLTYPERFAGVVALNGWLPRRGFCPLANWDACRGLKVLVIHGEWNTRAPIDRVRQEVGLMRHAGLRVAFQVYPTANRLSEPMLSDVDTWLIHQCTAEY